MLNRRILVIEDDPEMRRTLKEYLEENLFEVLAVEHGGGIGECLERGDFDLILLDVVLPGMDGVTLTPEIRKKSDIPIILVTGRSELLDCVEGLEAGYG